MRTFLSIALTTLLASGPELLEFPTRHLSLRTNYGAEASVLFIKFMFSVEEIDEVWMTEGFFQSREFQGHPA